MSPLQTEVIPAEAESRVPAVAMPSDQGSTHPITLPAALALSNATPLDVRIAGERVRVASAQLERARVQWLPNVTLGADYFRHDGQIQDIVGNVFPTSRSSILLGGGPQASVSLTDAVYAPLAAKQVIRAVRAQAEAVQNDTTLAVAIAYFDVQQARGDVAGSVESLRRADDLVARTVKLAPELTPEVEVNRAKTEAARRRQAVESAYERWQVSSAELTRLLRLPPGTLVEPAEEPSLIIGVIDASVPLDELIAIGLTNRPELAANQAIVQAALVRVKQEKHRPFYPTLAVRGVGSNTPGLAGGYFGGGVNGDVGNFGSRFSVDLQAVWELQNLGFGNRALVREREGESRRTLLELLRAQESVSAEIVQAHAQLTRATRRLKASEDGVTNAVLSADKNLQGLGQTKRVGEQLVVLFRPQEAVAAVTALDQAYRDHSAAVGDHNRAQFRLYRALGHPGHALGQLASSCPALPPTPPPVLESKPPIPEPAIAASATTPVQDRWRARPLPSPAK